MESVGAKLKKIRLEKGISIEEVQKKTKIHPNILKAIEEDNFINLSPVYVKGFLKIYCKFLGVDYSQYILEYSELEKKPSEYAPVQSRSTSVKLSSGSFSRIVNMLVKAAIFVVLIFLVAGTGIFVFRKISAFIRNQNKISSAARKNMSKPGSGKPLKRSSKAVKPSAPVEKRASAAVPLVKKIKTGTPIRLGIRAKEDCWIKLSLDGKVIFQSIIRKGRSENWQAKKEIALSLGNAGGVDLEVNGSLIPSVGRKGQAVKSIVINEDGLKVN
ncbi:MAG: RodZ domain-containing protein [Candidatus Omnitrophota bacterium]|jgi:cytoskeletal protein RodZ